MARQARTESNTSYYHVMMRGNNREYIFSREEQKGRFLEYLVAESSNGAVQIAGWCIMDNHVHLVLKGGISELAQAVKRINIKYAMGFNTLEGRIGHVFQDRFKSEPIEDDTHLLSVIRYIHNNPVKAKMTSDANNYKWSSYKGYLEGTTILNESIRELVLGYFGGDLASFELYHQQQDDAEYLEIKEDKERYREERAQAIIAAYCKARGLTDVTDFKRSPADVDGLIANLLNKSQLSYRKVAALLGVSYNRVSRGKKRD